MTAVRQLVRRAPRIVAPSSHQYTHTLSKLYEAGVDRRLRL
ncbi:MAG TPA: hypothetical protein VL492_12070 [Methylovirgula sp.]|nr:hypothetical protein [Methylovirgula sp.]